MVDVLVGIVVIGFITGVYILRVNTSRRMTGRTPLRFNDRRSWLVPLVAAAAGLLLVFFFGAR